MAQDGLALEAAVDRRKLIPVPAENDLYGHGVVQQSAQVTPLARIDQTVFVYPERVDVDIPLHHAPPSPAVECVTVYPRRRRVGLGRARHLPSALLQLPEHTQQK